MNIYKRHRRKFNIIIILSIILCAAIYFFTQTARGGSYTLYFFAGWHAPLDVKLACVKETDKRVEDKFMLPLNFDKEAKDGLKGFWYYSYYRSCLYDHGYDFSGNKLTMSSIKEVPDGEILYTNGQANIAFLVTKDSEIIRDNKLNVDMDDRLLISELSIGNTHIFVHTYLKNDDILSFEDLEARTEHLSGTTGTIITETINKNGYNVDLLHIIQDDNMQGIVLITPEKHIIHIFGDSAPETTLEEIANTIFFINK